MNVRTPNAPVAKHAENRSNRRERGMGTGYGRSSGYADNVRRYAPVASSESRFRVH